MDADIIITGAGPAGLCLARALRGTGLSVVLVESQPCQALAEPAFDGREIALTHHSRVQMQQLGLWERIDSKHIAPLRDALVLDGAPGTGQARMRIGHEHGGQAELGYLVGNHHIRRAAFAATMADSDGHGEPPRLLAGRQVTQVSTSDEHAQVWLDDGTCLRARLLVAADSRHSSTRRAIGIAADLHDYGRSMLVCAMTHSTPHHATAWEWFDHGQTLALLPMNPCPETGLPRASAVLTLPHHEIETLVRLEPEAFNQAMTARFHHQLGHMRLASTRHTYPLVGVLPRHLVARRFAAVGDAAVGMHPVTAHGFNLGLRSIETLSQLLMRAHQQRSDIAEPTLLRRYERSHQSASRGLYMATHAVASLYTRDETPARLLRQLMVRVGDKLPPFKRAVAGSLTGLH